MIAHEDPRKQVSPACQAPRPRAGVYDETIGALIDHLLVIRQHQTCITEHQDAISTALSLVHARLEEVLP